MNLSDQFLDFLRDTPSMLANFVKIVNEFYKLQGEAPSSVSVEKGPQEWKAGETHELTTIGISNDDLDAIANGYAEAVTKEKALEYIKGFVAGVMLAS